MRTVTRELQFDAGHRLLGHESKCAHYHGHRYVAEISVQAPGLDGIGRVVDFSVIKQLVGGWIEANWDHNMILNEEDPLVLMTKFRDLSVGVAGRLVTTKDLLAGKPFYVMPKGLNPTAEHMAEVLSDVASRLLAQHSSLRVSHVRLYETPNCWADH